MEYLLGDKGNLIGLNPTRMDWGTWDQGFCDPVGGGDPSRTPWGCSLGSTLLAHTPQSCLLSHYSCFHE